VVAEPHAVRRLLAALGLAAGPPPGAGRYMIGDLVNDGADILW
jgi:hypothetical protein